MGCIEPVPGGSGIGPGETYVEGVIGITGVAQVESCRVSGLEPGSQSLCRKGLIDPACLLRSET